VKIYGPQPMALPGFI